MTGNATGQPSPAGRSSSGARNVCYTALSLLYVLLAFVPWAPERWQQISAPSWALNLHLAFLQGAAFGKDVVFTFGPWGFAFYGYHPNTYGWLLLFWACLSTAFWLCAWNWAAEMGWKPWARACLIVAAAAATSICDTADARLFMVVVLFWLIASGRRLDRISGIIIGFMAAWVALVKFSLAVAVLPLVGLLLVDDIIRRRRIPWASLAFFASIPALWLLGGQKLSLLLPYVRNSIEIVRGYGPAMMLSSADELLSTALFIVPALLLLLCATLVLWRQRRWWSILAVLQFAWLLLVVFKAGYIRHDQHEFLAVTALLGLSLLLLPLILPLSGTKLTRTIALCPAILALIAVLHSLDTLQGNHFFQPRIEQTVVVPNIPDVIRWCSHRATRREAYEQDLSWLRSAYPLPQLDGTLDIYPWGAEPAVIAHGLNYRPRPVYESYSAYTPALAEMNARYLRQANAPQHILFEVRQLDLRLPAMDDGLSWPDLWCRYDIKGAAGRFLVLERASNPRNFELVPIGTRSVLMETFQGLPPTQEPLWAKIDIPSSVGGKLVDAIYRPSHVWLEIQMADGRTRQFQIVPEVARSGFLLSPMIDDTPGFAALALPEWQQRLKDAVVTACRVRTGDSDVAQHDGPKISLQLYRLVFPRASQQRYAGAGHLIDRPAGLPDKEQTSAVDSAQTKN